MTYRDFDLDHGICQRCRFGDPEYGHDSRDPKCTYVPPVIRPFGVPPAKTRRGDRRHTVARRGPSRRVLGFPVHDGGSFSWIDTDSHDEISNRAPVRGNVEICGVIVYTQDVERACLDLLRAGVRPWGRVAR